MNIKLFFIVGVEGCGHHALTPAIHASLSHNMKRRNNRIEINQPSIKLLNHACRDLWYKDHKTVHSRESARNKIRNIMQNLEQEAATRKKSQILIQDNSFPSVSFRTVDKQWDLEELAEITSPHADVHLLGLYRDPVAATFSHPEWDGGLRGHAMVIATFLEYLQKKLNALDLHNLKIVHYEDLVNKTRELITPLADYLEIYPADVEAGLVNIRKSGKNWKMDMPMEEQRWITSFFNTERNSRWPVFLDSNRNLLPKQDNDQVKRHD